MPENPITPRDSAVQFTVHSAPDASVVQARTRRGRFLMLVVLLVCAAPVVAAYLFVFVARPLGQSNYAELIVPAVPAPINLPLQTLDGKTVDVKTLYGQWLIVVVSGGGCSSRCERQLWLQRQLRETLGREKGRVDKVWLVNDSATVPETVRAATAQADPVTVLRVAGPALASWLKPAPGHQLDDHLYIVDPYGDWMMRAPAELDAARFRRDLERLLRVSAGWDKPGR